MKNIIVSSKCKKDLKRIDKQGVDLSIFYETLELLQNESPLPKQRKDHRLFGKLHLYRECHIASDLLLVYRVSDEKVTLIRLGSHSEVLAI